MAGLSEEAKAWSVDEVKQWAIKDVCIKAEHADKLVAQEIDGKHLLKMTEQRLLSYGISGAAALDLMEAIQPGGGASNAAGLKVFLVQMRLLGAMEAFGWRRQLFDCARRFAGMAVDPARMAMYEGVEEGQTSRPTGPVPLDCTVYFWSHEKAGQFQTSVRDFAGQSTQSSICEVVRPADLQYVANSDYDERLFPSPAGSLSVHTSAEASSSAPVLQPRVASYDLENIHVLPRNDFSKYTDCVFKGYHTLNQAMDGHNEQGVPFCYPVLRDDAVDMVFFNEPARRCHQFVDGAQVVEVEGCPAARIPISFAPGFGRRLFSDACDLRRTVLLPLWQRLRRRPDLRIKRNQWCSSSVAQQNWDAESLAVFKSADVGTRLAVTWSSAHDRSAMPTEWHGRVSDVVRGEDGNVMLFMAYSEDDDDGILYPLPNIAVHVSYIRVNSDAGMDTSLDTPAVD